LSKNDCFALKTVLAALAAAAPVAPQGVFVNSIETVTEPLFRETTQIKLPPPVAPEPPQGFREWWLNEGINHMPLAGQPPEHAAIAERAWIAAFHSMEPFGAEPMTPQKRFEFSALVYRTALASKRENPADTRIEDVYEVFERCGVVVTNLAELEKLRESK
jgi:hypothetical protein